MDHGNVYIFSHMNKIGPFVDAFCSRVEHRLLLNCNTLICIVLLQDVHCQTLKYLLVCSFS